METKTLYFAGEAAEILQNGGLVAVPTETVYGLAANATDESAVAKIFEVKGRPEGKALSILVGGSDAMEKYCESVPKQALALAEKYWPGPLTIILQAKPGIPDTVLAGGKTVGLRCPNHAITLSLLQKAGIPLAAPSANPSGMESPKNAQKVLEYFDGKIDAVIDGGQCGVGTESTILDLSQTPFRVLRVGALSEAEVFGALISSMTIVGITGGSGAGKSTAMKLLAQKGALTIDCDEVYHELTAENGELRQEIEARFGDVYENGKLDRQKLGKLVFSDENALKKLNEISHRHVHTEVMRRIKNHAANGGELAAIEAIELVGSRSGEFCSFKLGILAGIGTRIKRLLAREGVSEGYAQMRIGAQKPDSFFKKNCEYILQNNGNVEDFEKQCEEFFGKVLK